MRSAKNLEMWILELRRITLTEMLKEIQGREPDAAGGESDVYFVSKKQKEQKKFALVHVRQNLSSLESREAPASSPPAYKMLGAARPIVESPRKTNAVYLRYENDLSKLDKLAANTAKQIIGQIAMNLAAWHEVGVVHRDIKPANLLMSDRVVKFADLGGSTMVDPRTGKLLSLDISALYTVGALPPKFKNTVETKDHALSNESADASIAEADDENIDPNEDNTCVVAKFKKEKDPSCLGGALEDARHYDLSAQLSSANYLQLDTYAFCVTLKQLSKKMEVKDRQLESLIARLEAGAYPDNEDEAAFTMQQVLNHPYFGTTEAARHTFFDQLKAIAAEADVRMAEDILPEPVLNIVSDLQCRSFTEIEQKIKQLAPRYAMYRGILNSMYANSIADINSNSDSTARDLSLAFAATTLEPKAATNNLRANFTALAEAIDAEVQRLETPSCWANLFNTAKATAAKIAVIQAVKTELERNYTDNNSISLGELVTRRVSIVINSQTICLSLRDALCLQRNFRTCDEWLEKTHYQYKDGARSYDRVIANLNKEGQRISKEEVATLASFAPRVPQSK